MVRPTTSELIGAVLPMLHEVQKRFLPDHARDHIDEAMRLVAMARDELSQDPTGATCLAAAHPETTT